MHKNAHRRLFSYLFILCYNPPYFFSYICVTGIQGYLLPLSRSETGEWKWKNKNVKIASLIQEYLKKITVMDE